VLSRTDRPFLNPACVIGKYDLAGGGVTFWWDFVASAGSVTDVPFFVVFARSVTFCWESVVF
jgi:hypothetical protein